MWALKVLSPGTASGLVAGHAVAANIGAAVPALQRGSPGTSASQGCWEAERKGASLATWGSHARAKRE